VVLAHRSLLEVDTQRPERGLCQAIQQEWLAAFPTSSDEQRRAPLRRQLVFYAHEPIHQCSWRAATRSMLLSCSTLRQSRSDQISRHTDHETRPRALLQSELAVLCLRASVTGPPVMSGVSTPICAYYFLHWRWVAVQMVSFLSVWVQADRALLNAMVPPKSW
jgi:hypothetical protein